MPRMKQCGGRVQAVLNVLAVVLCCTTMMVFTACSDSDDNSGGSSSLSDIERMRLEEWVACSKPTFISGIENENPAFQSVIRQRFPNRVGSIREADIAFVSYATAMANLSDMADFYERGGLVVMMRPDEVKFGLMADGYLPDGDDEDFCGDEHLDELFYAYNKDEKHYTMYEEPPFDGVYEEAPEMSDEELKAIEEAGNQLADEEEADERQEWLYDNDPDQNENYFQTRFTPFIDFIEEIDQQTRSMSTRGGDDMKLSVEDGYFFTKDIPVSLNNCIQKNFTWNRSSSITVKYWVSSTYLLSSNGTNKAGDYYLVKSEVIPHLSPLWYVGVGKWGASRCRIYAYWFENMSVTYSLCYADNKPVGSDHLQYYKHPIPDNENTGMTYSSGFTWGLNGSMGGEFGHEGMKAQPNIGFGLEWNSSTSYELKSIQYERNTQSVSPSYYYKSANVRLYDDDYEDAAKTNKNFPEITHTEFTARTAWMWRVPRDKAIRVDDDSTASFKLRVEVHPVFASWYHWRWTAHFDSNKRTYEGYTGNNNSHTFSHTQALPAPDRTAWGILSLKNAASSTVANIKLYKQQDYTKDGSKAAVAATIPSSYNMNEVATAKLAQGTYALTFQTIDPDQNNKVLGNWKYENISVHQGKNVNEATTEISTVNATQTN